MTIVAPCMAILVQVLSVRVGGSVIWSLTTDSTSSRMPQQLPQSSSTLIQSLGKRRYATSVCTYGQFHLCLLTFPHGLTLLMSPSHSLLPLMNGEAQLDVHRKFLPDFGKFLHWITFTFENGVSRVKAQIMLPNRVGAACNMVKGDVAAAFIHSPFGKHRRTTSNNRRQNINVRHK